MPQTKQAPLTTPLGQSVFNRATQTSSNLDISETAEAEVGLQKGFQELSLLGRPVQDLIQSITTSGEDKLTPEQANEEYGVSGLIQFEEPIAPSLAKSRREAALASRERDSILAEESLDNTTLQNLRVGGYMILGALTDPTTFLPIAGPAGSLLKGAAELNMFRKSATFSKALGEGASLLKGLAPSRPLVAGAVRGALDVAVPNTVAEIALYHTAMNNGFDYDVANNAMWIGGGSTAAMGLSAIGARAGAKAFYRGQENLFGGINRALTTVEEGLIKNADGNYFLANAFNADVINKNIVDGLILRTTGDLMEGRVSSSQLTRAVLKLSDNEKDVLKFISNLEEGKYGHVIDEAQGKQLKIEVVSQLRKAGLDFKAFILNAIDDTLGSNKMFRSLVNISEISAKYGDNANGLKNVSKLLDSMTQQIENLNAKVREAGNRAASATKSKRAGAFIEHQRLQKELTDLIKDTEILKSFKSQTAAGKLDKLISKTKLKDYNTVTSSTFMADYKKFRDRIKARKLKDTSNFFNLSESSQEDIYRLYSMLGEDVGSPSGLDDLLKLTDDELRMRHQTGVYKSELVPLSREEAFRIIKDELLGNEIKEKQAIKELSVQVDREVNLFRNVDDFSIEDLKNEIAMKEKAGFLENKELKAQIEELDNVTLKELGQEKGRQEAVNCIMRSLANG